MKLKKKLELEDLDKLQLLYFEQKYEELRAKLEYIFEKPFAYELKELDDRLMNLKKLLPYNLNNVLLFNLLLLNL
jgi:hypothetical protein